MKLLAEVLVVLFFVGLAGSAVVVTFIALFRRRREDGGNYEARQFRKIEG
jgi:hypothetical protein